MSDTQNDRMEEARPARLTVLMDAQQKKAFEELCAAQDLTASQVVRQLVRGYLAKHGASHGAARNGHAGRPDGQTGTV